MAGIEPEVLLASIGGKRNDSRTMAITLAFELRIADAREVARHFGFADAHGARNAASRGRARAQREEAFARFRQRVLERLARAA